MHNLTWNCVCLTIRWEIFLLTATLLIAKLIRLWSSLWKRQISVLLSLTVRPDSLNHFVILVLTCLVLSCLQVDWVPNGKHKKTETGELVNEKALDTLRSIENRLDGVVESIKPKDPKTSTPAAPTKKPIEIPLSTTGQVEHLIQEATSFDKLSQMYMGWAPYL